MSLLVIIGFSVVWVVWCVLSLRNEQIRRRKKYKLLEEETGRGVNYDVDSSDDSDFFKMKVRKKNLPKSAPNGFKPANVMGNMNTVKATDKSNKRK